MVTVYIHLVWKACRARFDLMYDVRALTGNEKLIIGELYRVTLLVYGQVLF